MARIEIPYPHRRGGHCGSGALRDLTEWAQLGWGTETLSEGLVFTLGGALDFSYVRSTQLFPQIYLVGRGSDLECRVPCRLRRPIAHEPSRHRHHRI